MTALTAKAAWWVLEGWRGSAGSLRNDSFDGQSGHLRPGSLRNDSFDRSLSSLGPLSKNDSFDGQSCLGGFEALAGQSWIRDPLEMTALTAKAAWWVLKGWRGSAGSLRNDSFEQSGF